MGGGAWPPPQNGKRLFFSRNHHYGDCYGSLEIKGENVGACWKVCVRVDEYSVCPLCDAKVVSTLV